MKTSIFKPKPGTQRKLASAKAIKLVVLVAMLGALGGTVWWYFWGSKPRLTLSIPIAESTEAEPNCWPVGENGLAVLGGGKLSLVHVTERQLLWSVQVPIAVKVDYEWQASVAQRFLKLQQRAAELSTARANLKGEAAIKSFNADAAKYAADLATARADAARPTPLIVPAKAQGPDGKTKTKQFSLGDDRSQVDKLNAVQSEEETIRNSRIAKRAEQITKLRSAINELRTKADTRIKLQQVRDDEARLQSLENEQKADEAPKTQVASATPPETEHEAMPDDFGFSSGGAPQFASLGETLWLAEGSRLVGFIRSSGGVRANMNLPGPVIKMSAGPDAIVVAAHAGKKVRYVVKITPDGNTQTNYMTVSGEMPPETLHDGARKPVIAPKHSEFVGMAVPAIAEIQLIEKKVDERVAIKPGAEAAAEAAVQSTSGGGVGEALAILKVAENDKIRAETGGVEQIDTSTYEVKLKKLFAPESPEWTGRFQGPVQFFATPSFNLVTGGNKLVALNAANAMLWEASLGAPALIGDEHRWQDASSLPCLEVGDRLYFFDRAVLTAFNAANGEVLWRLPSVGIGKVAVAADGYLYVHSSNLSAESLIYLSEADSGGEPILMKINPADGSIVWTSEKLENVWTSGKDLYSMRVARPSTDIVKAVFTKTPSAESRSKIYKLNPNTGKARWEWFQAQAPVKVVARGKTLAILFGDRLQVVHSTSL